MTDALKVKDLDGIMKALEDGIMNFMDSDRYKQYLRAVSKFHNYSSNNILLITMQRPDATLVAGFSTWKNQFKRHVIKGEKGIKIIAPMPVTVEKERDREDRFGNTYREKIKVTIPRFKAVTVFDVSQTYGEPLPEISPEELTNDVENYDMFIKALEKSSAVPVNFIDMDGGAKGYFHAGDNTINIAKGMSQSQTVKTLIHEMAHSLLHNRDNGGMFLDTKTKEVQAESIAFSVCSHFGIDTSEYTFPYVSAWSGEKDLKELKASMETIRDTSSKLIGRIDEAYREIARESESREDMPAEKEKEGVER